MFSNPLSYSDILLSKRQIVLQCQSVFDQQLSKLSESPSFSVQLMWLTIMTYGALCPYTMRKVETKRRVSDLRKLSALDELNRKV